MLKKIISGGQTGIDRAALDAALSLNFQCGGFCPKGRLAEDGKIDLQYPLIEHRSKIYSKRTLENILSSDGTVIFFNQELKGGTALTTKFCKEKLKPFILIDAFSSNINQACNLTIDFINKNKIEILNVAGPRESQWKDGYQFAYKCIELIICKKLLIE